MSINVLAVAGVDGVVGSLYRRWFVPIGRLETRPHRDSAAKKRGLATALFCKVLR
jgi:hypothetical protein